MHSCQSSLRRVCQIEGRPPAGQHRNSLRRLLCDCWCQKAVGPKLANYLKRLAHPTRFELVTSGLRKAALHQADKSKSRWLRAPDLDLLTLQSCPADAWLIARLATTFCLARMRSH